MDRHDVLVIGGGIAGVSVGYELARDRSVCLLEMEPNLAAHATGPHRHRRAEIAALAPEAAMSVTERRRER